MLFLHVNTGSGSTTLAVGLEREGSGGGRRSVGRAGEGGELRGMGGGMGGDGRGGEQQELKRLN